MINCIFQSCFGILSILNFCINLICICLFCSSSCISFSGNRIR
nr:MAG TPA_asm: hypothetical protein [Caudoviricetes sp.]